MEITLRITVPEATTSEELADLEKTLAKVAIFLVAMRRAKYEVSPERIARLFLNDRELKPADIKRLMLEAQAYRQIAAGGPWLTAAEVADLAGLVQASGADTVISWSKARRIFAIHRSGQDYFPLYGLGSDFRPAPAMSELMQILPWPGEQLAAWFESTSSFLGGWCPRELFEGAPELVLQAARDERDDRISG